LTTKEKSQDHQGILALARSSTELSLSFDYPEAAADCWTAWVHEALSVGLKVNVLPPSPMSPEVEPYCKTACPFWRLPVFPNF
jgi:hypothetical protein